MWLSFKANLSWRKSARLTNRHLEWQAKNSYVLCKIHNLMLIKISFGGWWKTIGKELSSWMAWEAAFGWGTCPLRKNNNHWKPLKPPFFSPIWFNHVSVLTFKNITRGLSLCFTLPKSFSPFFSPFLHLQIGWSCWIEYLKTVRHAQAKLKRLFLQGKSMSNFMVEMFKYKPLYLGKYWLGWTVKSYFTLMPSYFSQQLL